MLALKPSLHHQQAQHWLWAVRLAATAAQGGDPALKALRPGQRPPVVVEFDVTRQQAVARFEQLQKQQCVGLHAQDVLKGAAITPALLPFWMFDATVSAEVMCTIGRRANKSDPKSDMVWAKMSEWRQTACRQQARHTQPFMQVYASYQLRRDLAEGAKPALQYAETCGRPLQRAEAEAQWVADQAGVTCEPPVPVGRRRQGSSSSGLSSTSGGESNSASSHASGSADASSSSDSASAAGASACSHDSDPHGGRAPSGKGVSSSGRCEVALQPPDMRQAVAWQLCYRQLKRCLVAEAVEALRREAGADDVKDLQMRLQVHTRAARLAWVPAYHVSYTYGEKYTPSRAEIVPERFEALVSGFSGQGQPSVVSELHPSPYKAQIAAAGTVVALSLAAIPAVGAVVGLDPQTLAWGLVDAGFAAFLTGAVVNVAVKRMPQMARNRHVAEQVLAEREFYKQYDRRESAPTGAAPDEHTLWLWMDSDWRKWEQEDPWHWDPAARQQWAEDLWKQQMQRVLTRQRHEARREQERRRLAEDERREQQRTAKFGASYSSTYSHFMGDHGAEWSGAGPGRPGSQQQRRKRRRDFLGYYRLMDIQLEGDQPVTGDAVKAAFKRAAMRLHPDKHVGASRQQQEEAGDKFRRLQAAYEVLRDDEKRRAYDRGQLMQ